MLYGVSQRSGSETKCKKIDYCQKVHLLTLAAGASAFCETSELLPIFYLTHGVNLAKRRTFTERKDFRAAKKAAIKKCTF
jgi:hypothetical protein